MHPVIAVDIGGTNLRVALVESYRIIGDVHRLKTPTGPGPEAVTDTIIREIHHICIKNRLKNLPGIGISAAGPYSRIEGALIKPPNLPFEYLPLVKPLEQAFHTRVELLNDCQAGVLGEVYAGAAQGCNHVVYITISTGIGGGIYLDGRLLSGRGGNAGEIGHFRVDTRYQQPCSCKLTGHWEGYCSGRGIPAFFVSWCRYHNILLPDPPVTAEEIFARARCSDPGATGFIRELGILNATGISQVIVAYDPAIIVLDGAVIQHNQDLLLPFIYEMTDRYLPLPALAVSPLAGLAPLLGAGVAALHPEILQ